MVPQSHSTSASRPSNDTHDPPTNGWGRYQLVLWPEHQSLIAAGMGLALVAMFVWLCIAYLTGTRWVDIDDAGSRHFQFQVDINSAEWTELAAIPGIGETLARRITDYRQVHGPFQSPHQLLDVPGIGETTLVRLEPYLFMVEPPSAGIANLP